MRFRSPRIRQLDLPKRHFSQVAHSSLRFVLLFAKRNVGAPSWCFLQVLALSGAEGASGGAAHSIISSHAARLASLLRHRSLALYHRLLLTPACFTLRTEPRPDALRIRTGFTDAFQLGEHFPQGLKPAFFHVLNGTAEAVPCPKPNLCNQF
jgi:hypothetical protein